ncbi:MAG: TMEM175 family protein [Synechococcaceae cyanobacterium ELA739]|jgi:hypothetical protein
MRRHPHAIHNHGLRSLEVLPLFDGVFAVAFTLLASSVPEQLMMGRDGVGSLILAIASFLLNGVAVLLYWFKLRRLVVIARHLTSAQVALGFVSMLTIVVLPKLSALAMVYGNGTGSLFAWTPAQEVNMVFLGALFLFDGFCLLFALSLRRHGPRAGHTQQELMTAIQAQVIGFTALVTLGAMELLFSWFNNQYVLLVPLVLLLEELLVARSFSRGSPSVRR